MAEAVAALGLAANIFQFLEYGTKFVSTAWTIWKSGPESVEAFSALQSLSNNIKSIINQLQPNTTDVSGTEGRQSEPERAIFAAAAECFNEAQRILGSLERVGAKDLGVGKFGRKRDSGKAAFRLMWKSKDIQALETKFERLQAQITLNLVASLRLFATETLEKQDEILQLLVDKRGEASPRITPEDPGWQTDKRVFGSAILDVLPGLMEQRGIQSSSGVRIQAVLDVVEKEGKSGSLGGGDELPVTLSPNRRATIHQRILAMLSFSGMDDREHSVAEAHESTFRWVFESGRSWTSLGEWLQSGDQLYWVTGKAGSGKSTLMKYICEAQQSEAQSSATVARGQSRCLQHLGKWAGNAPLTVASFYFWAAGSSIQTSKEGLYRTLLHKLLAAHTDVIEHVFPRHWRAMSLFEEASFPISILELKTGLQKLIWLLTTTKKVKVCLFVDGLDEFNGDHEDLVLFLQGLLTTGGDKQYIKICVASRPWVVFGDAFLDKPSLRLEDLTFNDIKDYVSSRFQAGRRSSELLIKEPEFANGLITEVVQKASGVFLWANLVVASLLDGIKNGDRISDLQQRLDELPPDLEDLYTRILDSLDPRYLQQAAQYFRLVETNQNNHRELATVLLLSFADVEIGGHVVTDSADRAWTPERLRFRIDTMKTRLNSRCKGLIETISGDAIAEPEGEGGRVQYLHRSVKDYIQKPTIQARLDRALAFPFDPHLQFCSGFSSLFKLRSSRREGFLDGNAWIDRWADSLAKSIQHSELVLDECVPDMVRVVDLLESAFEHITDVEVHSNIAASLRSTVLSRNPAETCQMSFPSIVTKLGGVQYLRTRIERMRLPPPVLARRIWPRCGLRKLFKTRRMRRKDDWNSGRPDVDKEPSSRLAYLLADALPSVSGNSVAAVLLLLESGADVNHICDLQVTTDSLRATTQVEVTPWALALAGLICSNAPEQQLIFPWKVVARFMLLHGADVTHDAYDAAMRIVATCYGIMPPPNGAGGLLTRGGKERAEILKRLRTYQKRRGKLELPFPINLTSNLTESGFALVDSESDFEG